MRSVLLTSISACSSTYNARIINIGVRSQEITETTTMLNFKKWISLFIILIPQLGHATEQAAEPLAFFVGHSQWSKGSQGTGLPAEWDYCRAVGEQVIQLAPQYHVTTKVFFRGKGGYAQAVGQMHKEKNLWDPSAPVISCHYNATPITMSNTQKNAPQLRALFANGKTPSKGSLMGTLVLYKPNSASQKIAESLLKNVQMIMPRTESNFQNVSGIIPIDANDRGAKEILSNDKAPVMILEIGYGDNVVDATIMKSPDFQKRLAEAILTTFEKTTTN